MTPLPPSPASTVPPRCRGRWVDETTLRGLGEPHAPLGGRPWRQLGGRGLGGEGRYIPLRAGDSADAADAPPPAIAEPADGDDAGAFETWLRRACEGLKRTLSTQTSALVP